MAAAAWLITRSARQGDTAALVGDGVFAATLILLYLASTLYHALPRSRAKQVLRGLDHAAIFLLISGTYTPFTLGVLRGPWGWSLLALVWGLSVVGIATTAAGGVRRPRLSSVLYLGLGWSVLIAAKPLLSRVPMWGLLWLLAGGIAYTAGMALYAAKRIPYAQLGWHVCVMAGSAAHFVAVLRYAR